MKPLRRALLPAAVVVLALGCERAAPRAAPSASVSVKKPAPKPNACAGDGGTLDDPARAAWFPRNVAGLCIDPHADFRSFGDGAKAPLGASCETLEGDCAGYVRYGLRRVLVVPYVSATDPRARVTVTLLELASPDASYALFARRVLGDAPNDFSSWKRLDSDGTALRSGARALAWRASHLALLDYTDETSAPDRVAERGGAALEGLARELVLSLPGKPDLPPAVALLPKRDGGPLAVRFEHEDLFGIGGIGSGALARYTPNGRIEPLAVLARVDDDSAKDVLKTLRRVLGSRAQKGAPYEALAVPIRERDDERRIEWLFGRKRNVVLGIGREPEKLDKDGEARARHAQMLRLKALLDGLR